MYTNLLGQAHVKGLGVWQLCVLANMSLAVKNLSGGIKQLSVNGADEQAKDH